jgi:hypothetical protein
MNIMRNKNKQPIVRPGQRKPYVKATRREIEQRLKAAAQLESNGWERSEICWFLSEVFGVEWRQAQRYIAHTRARSTQEP